MAPYAVSKSTHTLTSQGHQMFVGSTRIYVRVSGAGNIGINLSRLAWCHRKLVGKDDVRRRHVTSKRRKAGWTWEFRWTRQSLVRRKVPYYTRMTTRFRFKAPDDIQGLVFLWQTLQTILLETQPWPNYISTFSVAWRECRPMYCKFSASLWWQLFQLQM